MGRIYDYKVKHTRNYQILRARHAASNNRTVRRATKMIAEIEDFIERFKGLIRKPIKCNRG
jgi:hypothetical protein